MIIVDSHCHLDMLTEHDEVANIVHRAKDSNVQYLQTICTKLEDFQNILSITQEYDNIFASVGVHPSEVKEITSAKTLLALSKNRKVIGLGETGLDYFYNKEASQHKKQQESFIQHIVASQSNNLPVIVHTRDAEEDTYQIIKEYKSLQDFSGLIHCFTASREFAIKMLDLGMYISISGIVTFKNATKLQEVVKLLPIDRILVETDSPYLSPVPHRGKTNEPSYTKYIIEFIAKLRQMDTSMLAAHTTDNFFTLFSKAYR